MVSGKDDWNPVLHVKSVEFLMRMPDLIRDPGAMKKALKTHLAQSDTGELQPGASSGSRITSRSASSLLGPQHASVEPEIQSQKGAVPPRQPFPSLSRQKRELASLDEEDWEIPPDQEALLRTRGLDGPPIKYRHKSPPVKIEEDAPPHASHVNRTPVKTESDDGRNIEWSVSPERLFGVGPADEEMLEVEASLQRVASEEVMPPPSPSKPASPIQMRGGYRVFPPGKTRPVVLVPDSDTSLTVSTQSQPHSQSRSQPRLPLASLLQPADVPIPTPPQQSIARLSPIQDSSPNASPRKRPNLDPLRPLPVSSPARGASEAQDERSPSPPEDYVMTNNLVLETPPTPPSAEIDVMLPEEMDFVPSAVPTTLSTRDSSEADIQTSIHRSARQVIKPAPFTQEIPPVMNPSPSKPCVSPPDSSSRPGPSTKSSSSPRKPPKQDVPNDLFYQIFAGFDVRTTIPPRPNRAPPLTWQDLKEIQDDVKEYRRRESEEAASGASLNHVHPNVLDS
ncbi:hypothetical protein FRB99_008179 [Tulasnella sp. 403]|nr:hypothetical protein FRB99_008179 [Tulasnella sp. 403]